MAYQIWVQCEKKEVQHVKRLLDHKGKLSKAEKVKAGRIDGFMLIPTALCIRDETQRDPKNVLDELGLDASNTGKDLDILYLPSATRDKDGNDATMGVIRSFVARWLSDLPDTVLSIIDVTISDLLVYCPKRWSVYQPMLLLPAGSFQTPSWKTILVSLEARQRDILWSGILKVVWLKEGGEQLTHLAVNSGIPLNQQTSAEDPNENILRSPSGLIMLYGDWGPGLEVPARDTPTDKDFKEAFWVSTKQNGLYQTWAPRYTMFSRGNIKEKARILSFHDINTAKTLARKKANPHLREATAVDLYAGIGYFVFSYAQMGIGRVLCWEINPWSVEGLRRGIERNGWSYKIIKGENLTDPVDDILEEETRIIVFEESNDQAVSRINGMRPKGTRGLQMSNILHVNCGFLPSSEPSWRAAFEVLTTRGDGWLHLHENVGVDDIDMRSGVIESNIKAWVTKDGFSRLVQVEHVELVKTFAPGVWHVVFDVLISPGNSPP